MNDRWKQREKPASLEARFEFESYDSLRTFLDELAKQADALDHHPNVSFGREHASVVIYAQDNQLQDIDFALAEGIDESFHQVTRNS